MGIPTEEKKTLRASKGQFSSESLSEAFPPLVLHLRSSSNRAIRITDRSIRNRQQIESLDLKPILKVKNAKALTALRMVLALRFESCDLELLPVPVAI